MAHEVSVKPLRGGGFQGTCSHPKCKFSVVSRISNEVRAQGDFHEKRRNR